MGLVEFLAPGYFTVGSRVRGLEGDASEADERMKESVLMIVHPPFRIFNISYLDPLNDNTVHTSMYFHLLTNESDFLTLSSRK